MGDLGWDGKRDQGISSFTCRIGTLGCIWQGAGSGPLLRGPSPLPKRGSCSGKAKQAGGRPVEVVSLLRTRAPYFSPFQRQRPTARPQFWNAAGTPVLAVDSVEGDLGVTQTPHWLQRMVVRATEGGEKEATWLSQSRLLCLPWPELRFLSRFLP